METLKKGGWIPMLLFLIAGVCIAFLIQSFSQPSNNVASAGMEIRHLPISIEGQIGLVQDVAALNVAYLGISIAIILFIGGFASALFYFYNIKPFKKSLDEQGNALKFLEASIEERSNRLHEEQETARLDLEKAHKETREGLSKTDEELSKIKDTSHIHILDFIWNSQYMWFANNVPVNALSSLIEYRRTSLEFGKDVVGLQLWLECVKRALEEIKNESDDGARKLEDNLNNFLSKIGGHETLKKEIRELMKTAFVPKPLKK